MDMGPRSRCRRKTLTTHKSGFQPLFISSPFFLWAKATWLLEGSEIIGPAAKLAATVSVDSCRFFPADPLLPRPDACLLAASLPAHARPSRSLLKDEHALQRTGRGQ